MMIIAVSRAPEHDIVPTCGKVAPIEVVSIPWVGFQAHDFCQSVQM